MARTNAAAVDEAEAVEFSIDAHCLPHRASAARESHLLD